MPLAAPPRPVSRPPPLAPFFALVAGLSAPFYALEWATKALLLPGLPASALCAMCPGAAALALCYRADGRAGVGALWRSAVGAGRPARALPWLAALLTPAAEWLSYALPSAARGAVGVTLIPAPELLGMAAAFFVGAAAEELGWTTYALGRLRPRTSSLRAGLEIGIFGAAWHWPLLLAIGRGTDWIAWWSIRAVALRLVLVWLFRVTGGSTAAVVASHALHNLVWMMIPWYGSQYDPRSDAIATAATAAIVLAFAPGRRAPTPRQA